MRSELRIPQLGPELPRRGNSFSRWLGRLMMRGLAWRIEGELCQQPRCVMVMGPHTSYWDFTTNFAVLLALGLDASWFIANSYAKGLPGKFLSAFGAIAVERNERRDLVSQMVEQFNARSQLVLALFPEGTRKPVLQWKTGFWHIAKQAGVPVQLVAVDYAKRATVFGPVLELSHDSDSDIQGMREYFKAVVAKHPHKANY